MPLAMSGTVEDGRRARRDEGGRRASSARARRERHPGAGQPGRTRGATAAQRDPQRRIGARGAAEEQLTRRFGTSRAPLREALRLLGQQGLVEHLPRRGVRVTELSPQDVDELFSLREVLERFAVHTAPPAPDPLALAELADRLDAMQRAAVTGAALEQAEAHRQFHVALVAMAGHRHLLLVYEPVILKLQLYMAANLRREAQVRTPQDGVRPSRSSSKPGWR
ncbi:MAG: GntR family transcriptional regulator [Pseudonocardiaceae bacterium]